MRILYITFSFQHPAVRGSARCYYFIKELSKRHAITLLSLNRVKISSEALQEMASHTERILIFDALMASDQRTEKKITVFPGFTARRKRILSIRDSIREMKKAFLKLVEQEKFDVVILHGKAVFPVIEDWEELPIVIDFCDATSLRIKGQMRYDSLAKRPLMVYRYFKMRQLEKKMIKKTAHLSFISGRDREAIVGHDEGFHVVPNGMDLGYWTRKTNNPDPNCIMFSGGMDYRPNEDGALFLIDKIMPIIRKSIPNLEVLVVGRDPSSALMRRAKQYPGVTVTGYVEDMRPFFERATVYAAPLRYASGMQNKLLEALAMEVPAVTTRIAANGLRVDEKPAPVLIGDDKKQIAQYIIHLLKNEEDRSRLSNEGRRFIKSNFICSRSVEELEKMCADAIKEKAHKALRFN